MKKTRRPSLIELLQEDERKRMAREPSPVEQPYIIATIAPPVERTFTIGQSYEEQRRQSRESGIQQTIDALKRRSARKAAKVETFSEAPAEDIETVLALGAHRNKVAVLRELLAAAERELREAEAE